ncbi:MAG: flagellar M-ring protein FliF [Synergistaceae bacterium]|jgi:flagellar M-ring protein FliF|nr:flagellar M-ring protein FliF [Synergistaceae bacterium]
MENLKQLLARFLLFWATLKVWQKASLFLAVFLVLGLLGMTVFWAGRTVYEPLFTGLEVEDQSAIVAYLRENKIPYQLDPAANAILLPRSEVYEVRLSLAQEGLPRGGSTGFEIFDDSKMGMSEFQQRISYVRALEGELQRTLTQMDAIDSARVSIVIPEQRLFLEQQLPSTASVMVRLRPGARLEPDQIRAIIHLVSHSVDGLQPDNVAILDARGRNLSDMLLDEPFVYSSDGRGTVTSLQRIMERERERDLEHKVRPMLENSFGPGNYSVVIKVDLDFDKKKVSTKEHVPQGDTGQGIVRSTNKTDESYTGQSAAAPGVPGTTTNIPGYSINTQPVATDYNKTETTVNFEISSRESDEVVTPGGIRRVTASVLVNREQMPEAELAELRVLVSGAIGFNEARGDSVVVQARRFDTTWAESLAEEFRRDRMLRVAMGSVIALVTLACLGATGFWWLKRRRMRAALESVQKESKHVPTIQEMLTSPDMLAFQGEMAVLEEQLKAYARNNPAEVANLVNEWISSDS